MSRPRCGSCLWFDPNKGQEDLGRCLVDPPVPHIVATPNAIGGPPRAGVQGIRPPVHKDERCHRWESFHD